MGQVRIAYGKTEDGDGPDLVAAWGGQLGGKACAHMLLAAITMKPVGGMSVLEELAQRGYDITTLEISVREKGSA